MTGFSSPNILVRTSDGHNVTLAEPMTFIRPFNVGGERVTVPVGATSDGASIPRQAWDLLPPFGPYWRAAVLHDYLYRDTDRPKDECDLIFFEAMLALGVELSLARVIYNAVDQFAGAAFSKDRQERSA